MAKRTRKSDKSTIFVRSDGTYVKTGSAKAHAKPKDRVVTFGAVSISVPSGTSGKFTDLGAKASQQALQRAKTKLARAGVKLNARKGTALYRADPDDPRGVIRDIDGRIERGVFDGDHFKVRA